jgi:2-haloacid dehalogenase
MAKHGMSARETLAFDVYGTLVESTPDSKKLERFVPGQASRLAEVWRQKQLELTFRLTAMERYEDFDQVTSKALDFALASVGHSLDVDQRDMLVDEYNHLEPFTDTRPGLERLAAMGYAMVIFSNATPRMLERLVRATELDPFFQAIISVDEVRSYKPSPQVYRHVADRLRRPASEVRLVSSNPFDVIGAQATGMKAAWVNRSGGLFDPLGSPPNISTCLLTELADALERGD